MPVLDPVGVFEWETLTPRVRADSAEFVFNRMMLQGLTPWGKWARLASASPEGSLGPAAVEHMQQEGTLSHELLHLFQYLGTPLGLAVDALSRTSAALFVRAAQLLAGRFGYLRKPLLSWHSALKEADEAFLASDAALSAEVIRATLLGLGEFPFHTVERSLAKAPESVRRFEASDIDRTSLERLWNQIGINDFELARRDSRPPAVVPNFGYGLLGGLDVWEGWARWLQCHYLTGGWREPLNWSDRYLHAPRLFGEFTGWDVLPEGRYPTPEGLTFLAVCDVASQVPLHPIFCGLLSGVELSWRDFQPGWRFRTACRAVTDLGPLCSDGDVETMTDAAIGSYRRFTDELCAACGWPGPGLLAQASAGLSDESWPTRGLHAQACELRLGTPAIFGLSDLLPELAKKAEEELAVGGISLLYGWRMARRGHFEPDDAAAQIHRRGVILRLIYQLAFDDGDFVPVDVGMPNVENQRESRRMNARFHSLVDDFLDNHFGLKRADVLVD
jgi:hypothetical protein